MPPKSTSILKNLVLPSILGAIALVIVQALITVSRNEPITPIDIDSFFIGFMVFILFLVLDIQKTTMREYRQHFKDMTSDISKVSKISSDIRIVSKWGEDNVPLSQEAIELTRQVLIQPAETGPSDVLYALDWTRPEDWYNGSMFAYLAAQSNWMRGDVNRRVHRIFVWDELSNMGRRLLDIHCMLGFDTYLLMVSLIPSAIMDDYKEHLRDYLIWDQFSDKSAVSVEHLSDAHGIMSPHNYEYIDPDPSSTDNGDKSIAEYMIGISANSDYDKFLELFTKLRDTHGVLSMKNTYFSTCKNNMAAANAKYTQWIKDNITA